MDEKRDSTNKHQRSQIEKLLRQSAEEMQLDEEATSTINRDDIARLLQGSDISYLTDPTPNSLYAPSPNEDATNAINRDVLKDMLQNYPEEEIEDSEFATNTINREDLQKFLDSHEALSSTPSDLPQAQISPVELTATPKELTAPKPATPSSSPKSNAPSSLDGNSKAYLGIGIVAVLLILFIGLSIFL